MLTYRDVGRLQTLRALRDLELHLCALFQAAIALRLNSREVYEDILSILPLNKTVALGCVKPLHCTFFFHLHLFLLNYSAPGPQSPLKPKREARMDSRNLPLFITKRKSRAKCPTIIQQEQYDLTP